MSNLTDLSPDDAVRQILSFAQRHQSYRVDGGISLVASQNRISKQTVELLGSSFAAKFSSGERGIRAHAGAQWLDEMEAVVAGLAERLFGPWHVEMRPPAGSVANESLLLALTKPGDAIITPGGFAGGHASLRPQGFAGLMGLKVHDLPFRDGGITLDLDALDQLAAEVKPRLIVIGTAKILLPYPVADVAAIAAKHGARLVMDAAHVAGLIAGGAFPDPLLEGAEAYTGSTQKTFPGPVGGVVVSRDAGLHEQVKAVTRLRLDNYQNNRIAALGVVFAEMIAFGKPLMAETVSTARALGALLAARGLRVEGEDFGHTRSHMIMVDTEGYDQDGQLARRLEDVGLFTTATQLWPKAGETTPRTALRIGANDIARLGYQDDALGQLADLLTDIILARRAPEAVAQDVTALAGLHSQPSPRFVLSKHPSQDGFGTD